MILALLPTKGQGDDFRQNGYVCTAYVCRTSIRNRTLWTLRWVFQRGTVRMYVVCTTCDVVPSEVEVFMCHLYQVYRYLIDFNLLR